jgi:hypothetical protein
MILTPPPRPAINRPEVFVPTKPGINNPLSRDYLGLKKQINMLDPKSDRDNHSNQCNPNNDEYWNSRD